MAEWASLESATMPKIVREVGGGEVLGWRFATILADPPWPYDTAANGAGFAIPKSAGQEHQRMVNQMGYQPMSLADIKALQVRELAAQDAHLYLWTTNAFMAEAHEVAEAWGFRPKTIITWLKVRRGRPDDAPEPSQGVGYWYRSCTEHCLFCVRGVLRLRDRNVPNVILHPRLPHSVKPGVSYRLIEEQSPGPRLELFARRAREGWCRWGNEVVSTVSLGATGAGHVPIRVEAAPLRPRRLKFSANGG